MIEEQGSANGRAEERLAGGDAPVVELSAKLFSQSPSPRVLALFSVERGEGVTWVCRFFCHFLTQQMAMPARLIAASDCIAEPLQDNHGSRRGAVTPASGYPGRSDLFHSVRQDGAVVLIDCSSLETSSSILILAAHVDGVLLVVEDGRHSRSQIQRAASTIESSQGKLLGVVLNKRRSFVPVWLRSLLATTKDYL